MKLSGARVVVTGASRGLGEQLARALAAKGARLALVARSADAITKLAADLGGDAYPADLADAAAVESVAAVIQTDGPVDVLVNNAGVDLTGRFTMAEPDDLEKLLAVNLVAPVLLSRAMLPGMLERRSGTILNVSSLAGTNIVPGLAAYSTSKAGLSHFSAALRAEVRATPVTVILAELGGIDSEMWTNVHQYGPTERAPARLRRLQLLPTLSMASVVAALVRAIETDRAHVRMPRRDALFPLLVESPRTMMRWLLAGVDHQRD